MEKRDMVISQLVGGGCKQKAHRWTRLAKADLGIQLWFHNSVTSGRNPQNSGFWGYFHYFSPSTAPMLEIFFSKHEAHTSARAPARGLPLRSLYVAKYG